MIKWKIEEEISRYQKFTVGVLGDEAKIPKVDVRKYAKGACPRGSGGFARGNEGREAPKGTLCGGR
ncbi:hypothetical protein KKF38_02990 [Patescibacteria group bacterium]|nr:hypothetical protein [Patescibacteria group bacterium]